MDEFIIFRINGEDIPSPDLDGLDLSGTDLDNADGTGLNEAFKAVRKKGRTGRRQIKISWSCITTEQANKIDELTSSDFFEFQYFDVLKNKLVTKTFYRDTMSTSDFAIAGGVFYCALSTTFTEQ